MMAILVLGSILDFLKDPGEAADPAAWRYFEDGCLRIEDGRVADLGEARSLQGAAGAGDRVIDYRGHLILPGFIDTHVHYTQMDVIASFGRQLLDWLDQYTFPAERAFADPGHASRMAELFLDTILAHGTTTAGVYPSVHRQSVDAFFAAASRRKMRMVCGKVMMDRNCPDFLQDDVKGSESQIRSLIGDWHNKGRLGYALTPRFAPTSTPDQLAMAGRLFREFPDLWLQTHLAENLDEVEWVKRLFPDSRSYLDVYDRHGLLGERAIFGHCLHLDEEDRRRMAATGSAIAFCPTSNLFIGSGFSTSGRLDSRAFASVRHRRRRRHVLFHAPDIGRSLQGADDARPAAERLARLYLATLGGAEALRLEKLIGNFETGKEADFIVIDWSATSILERRTHIARSLEERLFALMMLGDDRAIAATHILGEPAWRRE
jgi:guanine deaminase